VTFTRVAIVGILLTILVFPCEAAGGEPTGNQPTPEPAPSHSRAA
jgi:hypothetical protein